MPIKFLNVPSSTNLRSSRPTGYKFPVGLSGKTVNLSSVDYLVVAGGGGGGSDHGGGGGAGGFLTGSGQSISQGTSYSVTVGGGGAGMSTPGPLAGANGSNSVIGTLGITAIGGGRGGGYLGGSIAFSGGSGGGADAYNNPFNDYGLGTPGQGNRGGSGNSDEASYRGGGAGGGANAVGGNNSGPGAIGGAGLGSPLVTTSQATTHTFGQVSGPTVYFSGGAGGGASALPGYTGGPGGLGGGGTGGVGPIASTTGSPNTGGGGGGGSGVSTTSGATGGKGVVIIRYAGTQEAGGGIIDTSNPGFTTHIFTGDGTFSVNTSSLSIN
jgi:hypothetical protein